MYTVESAMKALGCKNKSELSRKLECHPQALYAIKGELGSRLNLVVKLLVKIDKLDKDIANMDLVIDNKNAIIVELKK